MPTFAAVLNRVGAGWQVSEETVGGVDSIGELADLLDGYDGSVRLLFIEQDDEYAAIVRLDDEVRIFLTDGHAADSYPLAALLAEDLEPTVAATDEGETPDGAEDVPPVHDSVPFGDATIVEDVGTDPNDLVAMCVHPGTLPIDVLVAVCEKAGCSDAFDDLRG